MSSISDSASVEPGIHAVELIGEDPDRAAADSRVRRFRVPRRSCPMPRPWLPSRRKAQAAARQTILDGSSSRPIRAGSRLILPQPAQAGRGRCSHQWLGVIEQAGGSPARIEPDRLGNIPEVFQIVERVDE